MTGVPRLSGAYRCTTSFGSVIETVSTWMMDLFRFGSRILPALQRPYRIRPARGGVRIPFFVLEERASHEELAACAAPHAFSRSLRVHWKNKTRPEPPKLAVERTFRHSDHHLIPIESEPILAQDFFLLGRPFLTRLIFFFTLWRVLLGSFIGSDLRETLE